MSENNEIEKEQLEPAEDTGEPRTDEILEVEWESVKTVFEYRKILTENENYLSALLLRHEKTKAELLERIANIERVLYDEAHQLRTRENISTDLTYELKLPESEGEKGYFVRKQA